MIFTNASTTTSWWICIFLCAGFFVNPDQTSAQFSRNADSLFAKGEWQDAALEYERRIYSGGDAVERTHALLGKAECLKQTGDYVGAFKTIARVPYSEISDSLMVVSRFQAALVSYLDRDFNQAHSELLQMSFFAKDSMLYRETLFLHVLVLNEQRKWNEAKLMAQKMVLWSDAPAAIKDSLLQIVNTTYNELNYPKLKDKDKAIKWATFLPGSGHIYAGYTGEGIMNLTLQVASLGFIGYHIYISHFVSAFTIGSGMFQHFYFGGINRVQFLVDKRNYINNRKFNDPVKERIVGFQVLLY
ncbi:MAG: tetratricopeptide repeat protein [Bacteroidetes bacterium]|nr:tetratricopeptide repeat protein [Bacteroidota bacterium]